MSVCCSENSEPIARAAKWADRLVRIEADRCGLGIRDAASRVAGRLRASASTLLALIYEPPKDIGAGLYETLRAAMEAELQREMRALEHELALARLGRLGPGPDQVDQILADLAALRARVTP